MFSRAFGIVAATVALSLLAPAYSAPAHHAIEHLPRLILWAWERPEDFRGLRGDVGVAFLAQTIEVGGGRIQLVPRRQPLRVGPDTPLIAVTRIEIPVGESPSLTAAVLDRAAVAIAQTAALGRITVVQIDFDAVMSQRDAYRDLLNRVRQNLDRAIPISITALASWCAGDHWLRGLPIDEAVPMLFRMGPSEAAWMPGHNAPTHTDHSARANHVWRSPLWAARSCGNAIGTSLDEPIALPDDDRRIYVFNPVPWSDSAIAAARQLSRR